MKFYKNIASWIESHKGEWFRYWIYKKVFTPYEREHCCEYDSQYERDEASYGRIVEVVDLTGDYLVGISEDDRESYISYYKLSEIDLAWVASDQEE